jgi:hypothetical protein
MPKFKYRAVQIINDDSGKWYITDESIRAEYGVEASSSDEAIIIGNKKLFADFPELPLSSFLYGACSE